jgi:hypothetical protein
MTRTLTTDAQRKNTERQLFDARRSLAHLVELYDSGQWKRIYKEDVFATMVREARQSVDFWTSAQAN